MGVTSKRDPGGNPGAGKIVRIARRPTRLDAADSIAASGKTHAESQKLQVLWALFAVQPGAYPRPKNASQNAWKHGWPAN
jgi:hypothetical protein